MRSGLQSLTDTAHSSPSLAGDLELDSIRGRRPAYGRVIEERSEEEDVIPVPVVSGG